MHIRRVDRGQQRTMVCRQMQTQEQMVRTFFLLRFLSSLASASKQLLVLLRLTRLVWMMKERE